MFYARINRIKVFNNREGVPGLFNSAEMRICSFAAGGGFNNVETRFIASPQGNAETQNPASLLTPGDLADLPDERARRERLQQAVAPELNRFAQSASLEINGVKDNQSLLFGDAGFVIYQNDINTLKGGHQQHRALPCANDSWPSAIVRRVNAVETHGRASLQTHAAPASGAAARCPAAQVPPVGDAGGRDISLCLPVSMLLNANNGNTEIKILGRFCLIKAPSNLHRTSIEGTPKFEKRRKRHFDNIYRQMKYNMNLNNIEATESN
jgi:hypothetical protein